MTEIVRKRRGKETQGDTEGHVWGWSVRLGLPPRYKEAGSERAGAAILGAFAQ